MKKAHLFSAIVVSVHPPTENSLALRERVRVRACKTRVLQMPSPPAPLPQGEGGERLPIVMALT